MNSIKKKVFYAEVETLKLCRYFYTICLIVLKKIILSVQDFFLKIQQKVKKKYLKKYLLYVK